MAVEAPPRNLRWRGRAATIGGGAQKEKPMITIIDTNSRANTPIPEGSVQHFLSSSNDKTRVEVAKYEVAAGKTHRVAASSDRTQVIYILHGNGAEVSFTKAGKTTVHT